MASSTASKPQHVTHGFGPCYFEDSEILILGSFPSVKSREANFYYGHPMNRFWTVLAGIFEIQIPNDADSKQRILKDIHVALYDVIEECDIQGSSDSSIKNVVPTDLSKIIKHSKIRAIYLNGKKAGALFEKYQKPLIGDSIPSFVLPSTSPANAATSVNQLIQIWGAHINVSCQMM